MARWSVSNPSLLPVVVADTTNFTGNGFQALQGGSATQSTNVLEVYIGGQATTSSPCSLIFGRDSTAGATGLTGGRFAGLNPASAALAAPPVQFSTASTLPQRSATLSLLTLGCNLYGGIVRWVANPGEEVGLLGNTAALGEVSLSAFTGTAANLTTHFIVEPF
jgi:hypothetical protein